MEVTTPEGRKVLTVIPDGCVPGSVFAAQYTVEPEQPPPTYTFTQEQLDELMACGFEEDVARVALNRVMSTEGEGDTLARAIDESLKIQEEHQAKKRELVELGFTDQQAEHALEKTKGSVSEAAE